MYCYAVFITAIVAKACQEGVFGRCSTYVDTESKEAGCYFQVMALTILIISGCALFPRFFRLFREVQMLTPFRGLISLPLSLPQKCRAAIVTASFVCSGINCFSERPTSKSPST